MAQLPTQSQFGDYSDWPGRDVLDSGGQRLGGVREIYLDRDTGRPEWVLVDIDETEARFVPLANADVESWSIRVAHTTETIRSAPGIGTEPRIDQAEERRLYAHYGLKGPDDSGEVRPDDTPPAPSGWGERDTPSWQARGGESEPSTHEQPAAFSSPSPESGDTGESRWSRVGSEPTNVAPPPADPPSPAELDSAHIPDEPPAASDRASDEGTAPLGAAEPPSGSYSAFESGDERTDTSPAGRMTEPAEDPAAAFLTGDPESARPDDDDAAGTPPTDALAPAPETPSTLTPPATTVGGGTPPPVTADAPEAATTPKTPPTWASTSSSTQPGALERVKRSPQKLALAGAAAAVLFFIVRKLR